MGTMGEQPWEPADIEIYKWEEGVVLRNNSMMAFNSEHRILAIGYDAQYLQQENAEIRCPFKEGQIADWEDSCKLLKWHVSQNWRGHFFKKPKIAVCMRPDSTGVQKKAMEEAMYAAGAGKVILTELPMEEFIRKSGKRECDLVFGIGRNFG